MAAHNPKTANVKVEELLDARLIRKLDENGYMDRVAASYGLNSRAALNLRRRTDWFLQRFE